MTKTPSKQSARDARENGPWLLPPPWLPAEYELADVVAIQHLAEGKANEDEQKRALKWIVRTAAGYADLGWHPEEGLKDFAAGRRFVALQIEKLIHIDRSIFGGKNNVPA